MAVTDSRFAIRDAAIFNFSIGRMMLRVAQNPALATSVQLLIDKYTEIIDIHLADKDFDEAHEFMEDLTATGLTHSAIEALNLKISQMEQAPGKSKKGVSVGVF